jgi:hypothetical protein
MNNKEEQTMIGICPSCGKPLKIEQTGGEEDFLHCAEICSNPAAIPTGTRLMADQAKLLFVDSNMHEYTQEDYIKKHGIDPLPIWRAIEKWREEQIIRKKEPTVTIEKVTTTTKKVFEQKTANDILIFVHNLDDFEEADMFTALYIKAVNNTLESNKENYRIDENEVRKIIAETDDRFVYGEEVCEECEGCEED